MIDIMKEENLNNFDDIKSYKKYLRKQKIKNRPKHPFPLITNIKSNKKVKSNCYNLKNLSTKQYQLIKMLKSGARVLFDIKAKRGLVYTFKSGIKALMEISVRMLSSLVKSGQIIPVAQEGRIVHYALDGEDISWFNQD